LILNFFSFCWLL